MLFHDLHDAAALRRQVLGATRPGSNSPNIEGKSGFVGRLARGHRAE